MKDASFKINLEKDRPIINILGEVCWGFQIDDFEKKIGAKKEIVEMLLERLIKEEKAGVVETYVNAAEVEFITKALNEVQEEIEGWEFPVRIGVSLKEVKEISVFNRH